MELWKSFVKRQEQGKLSEVVIKASTRKGRMPGICRTPSHTVKRESATYWAVQWSWFARVNALCKLLCKKLWEVAASLPGWFLSRRCFMLCVTMEAEPRIAKQYKCHHCCSCKNYRGKGMEGGEKSVFASFWGWPKDRNLVEKNAFWGILSTSNKLLLVARHILTTGLQKCL